jgi:hypothetical protein
MTTFYDWLTVGLFAALIVLFLQRSSGEDRGDKLRDYLIAGAGCAAINQIGNNGMHVVAVASLAVLLFFIHVTLKPLDEFRSE